MSATAFTATSAATAPRQRIRLGTVGLSTTDPGSWALVAHINPLTTDPVLKSSYELVAVTTSNKTSAEKAAKAFGLSEESAFENVADMLAADKRLPGGPEVDMVVFSVKVPLHYQLALPALEAKKHLFVEWPLGRTTAEAEALTALAKKQGVQTAVGLQARGSPWVQKVKSIIDSGKLGRITSTTVVATTSLMHEGPERYRYINEPDTGVSIVSVQAAHFLDPLLYLLGEFSFLTAHLSTTHPLITWTRADGTKTSPPEPRKFYDSILIQGELVPPTQPPTKTTTAASSSSSSWKEGLSSVGTSLSFALHSTTPSTPDSFTCIISGEIASLKITAPHTFLQALGQGVEVFICDPSSSSSTSSGPVAEGQGQGQEEGEGEAAKPAWKSVGEIPSPIGGFGGLGEVYRAFAEKIVASSTGRANSNSDGGIAGAAEGKVDDALVDFEEAVKRHRTVDAIFRSAANGGRREVYL